jgi:hypothetical protein
MALADHIEGTRLARPRWRRRHRLPHRRGRAVNNQPSRFDHGLDRPGPAQDAVIEAQLLTAVRV